MEPMLQSLLDPAVMELRDRTGNKAYFLSVMLQGGYRVPEGYVLRNDFLDQLIAKAGLTEEFQLLLRSEQVLNRFAKLQKMIASLPYADEDRMMLLEVKRKLGGNIVIRSSAPGEDGANSSMAGLYTSYTNITDDNECLQCVLNCFASAYTQGVYTQNHFGEGTAIVMQTFVDFEIGGVAFSQDIYSDGNEMLLNYKVGGIEGVVSGQHSGFSARVPRTGDMPILAHLEREQVAMLLNWGQEFEQLVGGAVDFEWGLCEGNLYCVQLRPVTSLRGSLDVPAIVDIDDVKACSRLNLGVLKEKHMRWFDKKHHVRKMCKALGIRVTNVRYVISPAGEPAIVGAINDVLSAMETPYIEAYDGDRFTILCREQLLQYAKDKSQGFQEELKILVQEFTSTVYCGYASIDKDGLVYVETLPGGFRTFWLDGATPTTYLVTVDGEAVKEKIQTVTGYFDFCSESKDFEPIHPEKPFMHGLEEKQLKEIADMTGNLSRKLGEVRIEWVFDGNHIRFFDLSEETRPLVETLGLGNMLSTGFAAGQVCILDDIDTFDVLFNDIISEIDVVPKASFNKTVHSDRCQAMIEELLQGKESPIVVAEYPKRTLAVLADYVSGFIFERGALLCHLAIILREKQVPAVVVEDARETLRTIKNVRIAEGDVAVF
ncbi:PEP/pyruvate-binding domain-containing protein [Paenibacillus sp. MMS18-CY102]|uniref:PEP/pyruvate-binding domain-containing protein n=1 Tax=Paenibacillus sp. MMS18-CY102 TaxID=2682849 RepID=UPI001365B397|nr:PEP/pyruvate-binding domain-containing protein [Paenibacillus sp. MMS18-CY102]